MIMIILQPEKKKVIHSLNVYENSDIYKRLMTQ
jgi:hypothetical protein